MSLLLPGATLRQRHSTIREVVKDFDAFNKTVDEVNDVKRAAGGFRELF